VKKARLCAEQVAQPHRDARGKEGAKRGALVAPRIDEPPTLTELGLKGDAGKKCAARAIKLDDRFHVVITVEFIWIFGFLYRPREPTMERGQVMAACRRAIELSLGDEDTAKLMLIAQSRTEPASRVERARILLAYREDPSFFLRLAGRWGCTIRRSSAASSVPWSKARWLRSTIARVPAGSLN
jgi:hypothetical protein